MSFISENVDEHQKTVTFIKEQYDDHMKIVMFSFTPTSLTSSRFGTSRLDVVHDFNTGVQYIIDQMRGNCTTTKIDQGMFDDVTSDIQHVRIRTAREFFYFNSVYTYEGVKNIRGVDCDTWVSQRTDYPAIMPQNSTWEWAFVSNNWTSAYDFTAKYKTPIPWQVSITIPGMSVSSKVNLYEFDASAPKVFEFDITNCLANKRKRTFQFAFPASTTSTIVVNKVSFRYSLLKSILQATSVSPLRVSNLQTEIIKTLPTVTFDLLDVAPIKGDSTVTVVEPTIDDAANRIISKVSSGQFVVMMQANSLADPQFLVPTANSLRELTVGASGTVTSPFILHKTTRPPVRTRPPSVAPVRTAFPTRKPAPTRPTLTRFPFQTFTDKNVLCQGSIDGYTAGTMAGVSVAMVIFGGFMGGGFAVLLSRRRRIV
ncbi:uncharacterized protein LOC121373289 [Gigantopelta aegis]|uniref:uncharacterized protein LOC121373289 n=1 Tax=Gigantopelta aegis TaxID=1735272 RepID=UPI001B88A162|nr:uncharacterized protein LOC121373289 [Gigantopelta aegis]